MHRIFSTKERIGILRAVIYSEKPVSVSVIASMVRISKGLVSKYLDILLKKDIVKKSNGKYLVVDSASTKAVRILLNIMDIETGIFKKYDFIDAAGLYGSCARGENNEDSDVDLWLKTREVSDAKLAPLSAEISRTIKNVKLLFLTKKKIENMRKKDELFYHSLAFGSIIIYGDKDAIQLQ